MTRRQTNGFTLIEMLTVLVIIGILLGAALPAVTHLMKSSGLNVATREVANTLSLARQLAITQRVYARVVFPYSKTGSQPDMWYRTYAVMTNNDSTATLTWKYVSKWEYLPVGVVFLNPNPIGILPLPAGTGALDDAASLKWEALLPFPDTNLGDNGTLCYIEFNPTGVATPLTADSITPSALVLTEGFTSAGVPTATSRTITNTLANYSTITVDALVGRIQVTRP
ncbi:MAG TPA: prepilin-type N-terminal cleavage/methylation domain-containing protein [Verrucomicrobiae bacterium]|nr:prepilin-type N-terminal cleavage/methylation domain-containing protein [Verrucomicrobiae bacterium]